MGIRYRKSINLGGGFKVNISKSGIGYSWGTKGYRITKTAKGTIRRTASIPGTGISFVEETGKKKAKHSVDTQNFQHNSPPIDRNHYDTKEIVNGIATDMVSDGLEELLHVAQKTIKANKLSNIGIGISLVASFINPLFILLLIGFIIGKICIHTIGKINLDYSIDDDQQEAISQHMDPMLRVTDSNKVWRIMQSSKVIDKKYSAGAANTVKRIACQATKTPPFPFRANVSAATFKAGNEILVFFPDKLFIIQGSKIGALSYSDISTPAHTTKFVESEYLPKDAKVIEHTWKYVNKSGGPDKRFKDNVQLPVCLYGEIELKSNSGLNTIIMFSNVNLKS